MTQQTIGMIGGASWESTQLYYKLINESVRAKLGGLNSAKLLLYSLNYEPIVALEQEGKWDAVGREIATGAEALQNAGADFVILCCNTLHKVTPSIESAIHIPFLHIADAAGRKLAQSNFQKVGLLGTLFTMEDHFYSARLKEKFGLETITPNGDDRKQIDEIIYTELCLGKALPTSKEALLHMIKNLQNSGAEAILLACTELGILLKKEDVPLPLYDTTLLHVDEIVRTSLETFSEF